MVAKMRTIFVQTGHPCQKPPAPFVVVEIAVEEGKELQAAKLHRKDQANFPGNYGLGELAQNYGFKLVPSDLYWAIFLNPADEKPYLASDNYYWRQR